jgi:hypothetical protein
MGPITVLGEPSATTGQAARARRGVRLLLEIGGLVRWFERALAAASSVARLAAKTAARQLRARLVAAGGAHRLPDRSRS